MSADRGSVGNFVSSCGKPDFAGVTVARGWGITLEFWTVMTHEQPDDEDEHNQDDQVKW